MGQAWAARSDAARQVYDQADQILDFELSKVSFEGPAEQLNRTDITQAALYTAGVACYRALVEDKLIDPDQVVATAGLSLGEFTALHLAGALNFQDGLKLVRLRGQAMQDAAEAVEGGSSMVALIGADEQKANALCDAASQGGVLVASNFNAPGQVVISGSTDACARAVEMAGDFDLVAKALVVAGAFHSPLMQPAADRLAAALDQADWSPLQKVVISNVTANLPFTNRELIMIGSTEFVRILDFDIQTANRTAFGLDSYNYSNDDPLNYQSRADDISPQLYDDLVVLDTALTRSSKQIDNGRIDFFTSRPLTAYPGFNSSPKIKVRDQGNLSDAQIDAMWPGL